MQECRLTTSIGDEVLGTYVTMRLTEPSCNRDKPWFKSYERHDPTKEAQTKRPSSIESETGKRETTHLVPMTKSEGEIQKIKLWRIFLIQRACSGAPTPRAQPESDPCGLGP